MFPVFLKLLPWEKLILSITFIVYLFQSSEFNSQAKGAAHGGISNISKTVKGYFAALLISYFVNFPDGKLMQTVFIAIHLDYIQLLAEVLLMEVDH